MRKAFRKETSKDALSGSSSSTPNSNKSSMKSHHFSSSKETQNYDEKTPVNTNDSNNNSLTNNHAFLNARMRSQTFDSAEASNTPATMSPTIVTKSKQKQSSKYLNKFDALKRSDINSASKLGSMDNLNKSPTGNVDRAKIYLERNNYVFDKFNQQQTLVSTTLAPTSTGTSNQQSSSGLLDKSCVSSSSAASSSLPEYDLNEYELGGGVNGGVGEQQTIISGENKENLNEINLK